MPIATLIVLHVVCAFAHANQLAVNETGHAQDSIEEVVDKLLGKLISRALEASTSHHTDMDETMLGKASHLAAPLHSNVVLPASRLPSPLGRRQSEVARLKDIKRTLLEHRPRKGAVASSAVVADLAEAEATIAACNNQQCIVAAWDRLLKSQEQTLHEDSRPALLPSTLYFPRRPTSSGGQLPESAAKVVAAEAEEEGQVVEVHSEQELDNAIAASPGLAVVQVVSTHCRACKRFRKKYQRVAQDYYGKASFLKLNAKQNEEMWDLVNERFNTNTTPSFYFLRDGKVVQEQQGPGEVKLRSTLCHCLQLDFRLDPRLAPPP